MPFFIKTGPEAHFYLSGIFTLYKPYSKNLISLKKTIKQTLVEDLNLFKSRPLREKVRITGNFFDKTLNVETYQTLSDHPLVIGPRYQEKDLLISVQDNIDKYYSGVICVGISSNGCFLSHKVFKKKLIKEYEIKCRVGIATKTGIENSDIKYKSSYKHLNLNKVNDILTKINSNSIKFSLKSLSLDMSSQETYDLFEKGSIRTRLKSYPVIYNLKCVDFKLPYIKLIMQVLNENSYFFNKFIFELGLELKTYMCISTILRTRIGKFNLEDALLVKDINVENVLKNIIKNQNIVKEMLSIDNESISFIDINENKKDVEKVKLYKYQDI